MRVLVTGGNGSIGCELIPFPLAQGHHSDDPAVLLDEDHPLRVLEARKPAHGLAKEFAEKLTAA